MAELITPPTHLAPHQFAQRYPVFLAGPVQGTHDWQAEFGDYLAAASDAILPMSPRGSDEVYAAPDFSVIEQIRWEKRHIRIARDMGHLSVWFAPEEYPIPGRAFAQTSRIELGRFVGWRDLDRSIRLSVGIDPDYHGGNRAYIEELCAELGIPCHASSEALLDEIVANAQHRRQA